MSEEYANYNYKMPATKSKQTSVEFLFELLPTIVQKDLKYKFEQAKTMHKEEIIRSHMNVSDDRDYRLQDVILKEFAEEYYEKNYAK